MYVCEYVPGVDTLRYQEGVRSPRDGVTVVCEPPNVDALIISKSEVLLNYSDFSPTSNFT